MRTFHSNGRGLTQEKGHDLTNIDENSPSNDGNHNASYDDRSRQPQDNQFNETHEQLAREFGVEAHLVQALVQRLSGMS
jgi:hypothetical protein